MSEAAKEDFKKELLEMAKKRGLDLAEDAAGDLASLALDVVGSIIKKSSNTYDDLVWAAVEGKAREVLADLVDKIDGEEG